MSKTKSMYKDIVDFVAKREGLDSLLIRLTKMDV